MNEKKVGIFLGYLLIVVDSIAGILFTPILLKFLGDSEYGLYKLVVSWTSIVSVLDFGLGGTITRYVVKYKTENNKKNEQNFLGMAFTSYAIMATIVFIVGLILCFILPDISKGIEVGQIIEARFLFFILIIKTCFLLFNHAYSGWFTAYEKFTYNKILTMGNVILRLLLVTCLVPLIRSAVVVVCIDAFLTLLQLIINLSFSNKLTGTRVKLIKWDNDLFKEIMAFTFSIFLGTVINQFNGNIDNIVLGIFSSTTIVGLYACAMQIYTIYSMLSASIQEVYLPSISRAVFKGKTDNELTRIIVTPSRIQLIILMLALTGFVFYGLEFLQIWIGDSYSPDLVKQAYIISVIIMISASLQLFQNTATCILKAKNMLRGKVFITGISTVFNFIITILLVPKLDMLGAAIGTVVSMVFGYGIALSIYYHKKVGINMYIFFKETLQRLWYALIIAFLIGGVINLIPQRNVMIYFGKMVIYTIIYFLVIYKIGLNKEEKLMINRLINSQLLRIIKK